MKSNALTNCESYVSRSLAAEDLKCGDFVAILQEIVECPSILWSCDPQLLPPGEVVRLSDDYARAVWKATKGEAPRRCEVV